MKREEEGSRTKKRSIAILHDSTTRCLRGYPAAAMPATWTRLVPSLPGVSRDRGCDGKAWRGFQITMIPTAKSLAWRFSSTSLILWRRNDHRRHATAGLDAGFADEPSTPVEGPNAASMDGDACSTWSEVQKREIVSVSASPSQRTPLTNQPSFLFQLMSLRMNASWGHRLRCIHAP